MIRKGFMGVAFLLTGGCAQQMFNAAQQSCAAYGFTPGTNEYANCVQTDYYNRQARLQGISNSLSAAGAAMRDAPDPVTSYPHNTGPAANLVSQSVQGGSRLCVYNRMGSPYVITLSSVDICPIVAP